MQYCVWHDNEDDDVEGEGEVLDETEGAVRAHRNSENCKILTLPDLQTGSPF